MNKIDSIKDTFSSKISQLRTEVAAIGLSAFVAFNPVHAEDTSETANVDTNSEPYQMTLADDHAMADYDNIAVLLYYGPGNGATPDQAGKYVMQKIKDRHEQRMRTDPSYELENINLKYFIEYTDPNGPEGIAVSFLAGGVGIGPFDIRDAVKQEPLDKILDFREISKRLLSENLPTTSLVAQNRD